MASHATCVTLYKNNLVHRGKIDYDDQRDSQIRNHCPTGQNQVKEVYTQTGETKQMPEWVYAGSQRPYPAESSNCL